MGYTPLFDSALDGTLYGKWPHTGIWTCLLSQCNRHGEIDVVPALIAAKIGVPVETLLECIADFMKPDPGSRTPAFEGRRLELIEPGTRNWGWRVINHSGYRNRARKASYDADRTASGADADRKRASREASRHVPTCPDESRHIPPSDSDINTDLDSDTDKENTARSDDPAEFLDFKIDYPNRAGGQGWRKAVKNWNARLKDGYTPRQMIDGGRSYAAHIRSTGNEGTQYVKQACVFLGPDLHFLEDWKPAPNKAEARLSANVSEMDKFLAEPT